MKSLFDWWHSLRVAPAPLTGREKSILAAVTALTAITRWLALSRTPWDWDEMLFMLAMRDYNVALHHPHPPGFPLFIIVAKIIHLTGLSDFRSLQAISFLGAVAIVPATFFLCRELRMRFAPSLSAGAILAFFPNVWFFGGTAFSDVPSMTLVIVASALLFRGCHDRRAYFAGAAALGIAGGFRPQNLVIGAAPSINASVFRKWRAMIVAMLLGGAIVGGAYAFAAQRTGWSDYREALAKHSVYISTVDSFRNAGRPPLWRLFDDFFIRPYHAPVINTIVTLLVALSVVGAAIRMRPQVVAIIITFGPFCLFAWLMLDRFSTSRFSIGYAPMIAILAADGASVLAAMISRWDRHGRAEAAGVALFVVFMAVWSWPAIRTVREQLSPPVASAEWIRTHIGPTEKLYVHAGMGPFADELLPDRNLAFVDTPPTAAWSNEVRTYYWREGLSNTTGSLNFTRENDRLWAIARQRYFEVSLRPLTEEVTYRQGWYDEEGEAGSIWRWMGARSVTTLPPVPGGRAHLSLSFYVPLDALPGPAPNISILVNGKLAGRVSATKSNVGFEGDVEALSAPNELVIETDRSIRPADISRGDARVLGLRLNAIGWQPAR